MTGLTPDGFVIDRHINAVPDDVFTAWTTAEYFARWFGGSAVDVPLETLNYELQEGGVWSATMILPDGHTIDWAGDFVTVTRPERLVLTLTDQPDAPERLTVTVSLTEAAGGTDMNVAQEAPGFTAEQREATIAGWQSFFDELAVIAESLSAQR